MPAPTLERLLDELDELKRPAGPSGRARLRDLLNRLGRREFDRAAPLIRFHEILLFMRAYPQSRALLRQAEEILTSFHRHVEKLRAGGAEDFDAFAEPEVSGIAGTSFVAVFSYDIVRWLAARHPGSVHLDWEGYEEKGQLATVLPLLLPLLDENAYVDNFFSPREWLRAARGRESELAWLIRGFERLPVNDRERAALFDSLKLAVRWELGDSAATRTHLRRGGREIFYHGGPLISRRDISLARELEDTTPFLFEKLLRPAGQKLLDLGRETMTARYRELYGFTYGDARSVRRVDVGRGVDIFVWGVPADRRFPTIAYHAMLIFKNGVPAGYAEGLTLFERTEVGLNLFYTFREGESAWIYARLLRLMRQLLGARVFSVEPYQLGFHNEEGIDSGAFWFYRKLGFRPVVPRLAQLATREERKIAARPGYRSPERILRELATGHMLYEAPSAARGCWDGFHLRHLGLAVQRRIQARHGGDPARARRASAREVARALGARTTRWNEAERRAFENLSLTLALIPDLSRWTEDEKREILSIARAKAGADELRYLRLLQKHQRLRRAILKLSVEQ